MTIFRTLSLFAGVGGFDLGLERTSGFRTVAFCEIAPFPRAVLAKHWPEVPCYDDVRTLTGARLAADGIAVDAICGGFPCQGISAAGRGAGLDDPRSGLWSEYARIIGEVRPRLVLIENSPRLRTRGADRVCADLEAHGYAWWAGVVGAVHVGAPHKRERVWIVAHSDRVRKPQPQGRIGQQRGWVGDEGCHVADTLCVGLQGTESVGSQANGGRRPAHTGRADAPHADIPRLEVMQHGHAGQQPPVIRDNAWGTLGGLGGVADGVPAGLDRPAAWERDTPRTGPRSPHRRERLTALGNAVVPQVAEAIGRAVLAMHTGASA